MEKCKESCLLYNGKVLKLFKDCVVLDSGIEEYREVIHHNGGVCIAIKNNDKYYLIKQYRYACGDYLFEFPAGKLEIGEDITNAIIREAIEETGCTVKNLEYLSYFYPTCGYSNEKIHLFTADVEKISPQQLEAGEDIELYLFSLDEIKAMIDSGEIVDGKTILLAYKLLNRV